MNELVSIVVLAYHSEPFILETLESIRQQDYSPIELIITDDGSTDQTLSLCKNWLKENSSRFQHVRLLTTEKNTGTSRNANRGVRASSGGWIKIIAGDDLLFPDCISSFIRYIHTNEAQVVVSSMIPFKEVQGERQFAKEKNYAGDFFYRTKTSARQQFLASLFRYCINSPTLFMKRSAFDEVDGYDEEMKIIEDMAIYFRFSLHRKKIHYLNQPTVYYRMHASSVSRNEVQTDLFQKKEEDRARRFKNYIEPNAGKWAIRWHKALMKVYYSKNAFSRGFKYRLSQLGVTLVKYRILE